MRRASGDLGFTGNATSCLATGAGFTGSDPFHVCDRRRFTGNSLAAPRAPSATRRFSPHRCSTSSGGGWTHHRSRGPRQGAPGCERRARPNLGQHCIAHHRRGLPYALHVNLRLPQSSPRYSWAVFARTGSDRCRAERATKSPTIQRRRPPTSSAPLVTAQNDTSFTGNAPNASSPRQSGPTLCDVSRQRIQGTKERGAEGSEG